MSALTALGGSGRASLLSAARDDNPDKDGTGTRDFASMMDSDTPAPPPTRPQTERKPQDKAASRDDRPDQPAAPARQPDPARTGRSRGASTTQDQASETSETSAGKPGAKAVAQEDRDDDDAWPPVGLAGIGMAVVPVLNTAMPGAAGGSLTAAGLAGNAAGAAAAGVAVLPGLQLGAPGAATTQAGPGVLLAQAASSAGTSSGTAANGAAASAALLARGAASSGTSISGAETTATSPLAPLAALGGTAENGTDDVAIGAGTDPAPINLQALPAAMPTSRVIDSATPFSGSPTPTPDLRSDQFDDALGARMSWLADQKIGHAHIKISPAELGPVEVRLHLNGDQVNASFLSAQAEVRHALENSLPRLREMLGQHGFQLGQADVGQQQQQASQGQSFAAGDSASPDAADELLQGTAGIPAAVARRRGLLDAYA
ncbi:flagellar hook-length control protein FliK [Pseudoxanthomonas sp.]|uniref:flagellar hook-length control protein FliK n=1 Tax=Pseudoxanthomonas sp. TaxID=1871049 RepID=UPI002637FD53|nr:flagellar hook-length control protein FliK [Pseudoxanthomonas sp.]WDS36832.1 MAG: flagellar hook-length control protein FliK [Pseudoxanthomonas sp.]